MGKQHDPYNVISYYQLIPIKNPEEEVKKHQQFIQERDITCRIYLSEQGINGQLSASIKDVQEYVEWMHLSPTFQNIHFKVDHYHTHVFPRKTVKYRPHLVGHDKEIDLSLRGKHVSPIEWKRMLESNKEYLLLDIRNDYEWTLGHFEGATLLPCKNFREFEHYAKKLKKESHRKPSVMMYCTGGIRCELYSSILLKKDFREVYQLEGGIINYGQKVGTKHWLGKLFVFDDRLSVPISKEESPVVGTCHYCKKSSEIYYNCANMDCNTLFLCCPTCLSNYRGCCTQKCQNGQRVRAFHHQHLDKPFRRKHHYLESLR